jgi:hypothetical protein
MIVMNDHLNQVFIRSRHISVKYSSKNINSVPAYWTEVQGNHQVDCAAKALPIYTQIPARSAKKDCHNTINKGYKHEQSKKRDC